VLRRASIASVLLIAAALYLASASKSVTAPILKPLSEFPTRIGDWEVTRTMEMDAATLKVLGVDDYLDKVYSNSSGTPIGFYVGYYVSQRQGDSIHSPLNCLPGAGWNPVEKDRLTIPVASAPEKISINRILIQKGEDKQIVYYWYQSHGRVIASEYWGKIYTVVDAIKTNRTDAALVRINSAVLGTGRTSEEKASREALDFIGSFFPLLSQYLPN
jgi:EpsI family protein